MSDSELCASDDAFIASARDELHLLFDEVIYTEKTHLAAAERLGRVHWRLGTTVTAAGAVAAVSLVAQWSALLAGLLAAVASVVGALLTFMRPDRSAEQHLAAGRQLAEIRVEIRQVLNLDVGRLPPGDVRDNIQRLSGRKAAIDATAPATTQKDYDRASAKIKSGVFARDERPSDTSR